MPPGVYDVRLTRGAEADMEALHAYVAEHRSAGEADALLDGLIGRIETLERFPERGSIPKELADLGVRDFRQILHPPYRLIYRVVEGTVYILVVADGRRDMQSLLRSRLLRA